ncbi:MAG: hypothetical protein ACJ8AI_28335 [Rhodopila sp.]
MRHLPAQLIMDFPSADPSDTLGMSILKALLFRVALAFLTASVYPAAAAAPTCLTETHGRPTAISACARPDIPPCPDGNSASASAAAR